MSQSGSLKEYLRLQYGVNTQKAMATFGKELVRAATFYNHHNFTLRCYRSGIVPGSLRIKASVNSEIAAQDSKIFTAQDIMMFRRFHFSSAGLESAQLGLTSGEIPRRSCSSLG